MPRFSIAVRRLKRDILSALRAQEFKAGLRYGDYVGEFTRHTSSKRVNVPLEEVWRTVS